MDSPSANEPIPQKTNQVPLNCPRCGSYNTKFCYYNNYTRSQPRHFCRSCKRYWTKGGTLRNVPIGGGCRKNKHHRHHSSNAAPNPTFQQRRSHQISNFNFVDDPLFHSLWTNPIGIDFPISRMNYSARVCPDRCRMNGSELGFSTKPGLVATELCPNAIIRSRQIQDAKFSITGGDDSVLFGSTCFASSTSTMARLLASGLQQEKTGKEVKMEHPNPMEQIVASSLDHSSSIPWSMTNFAAWIDP